MADAKKLIPIIKRWEGGYSNHPLDKGGPTMKGVTLVTFRKYYGQDKTAEDLKNITDAQWFHIFKKGYWDPFKADDILSQSIANLVVDWAWGSGPVTAIKKVQKQLGVYVDGKVGPITLAAINTADPKELFDKLWNARKAHFEAICKANPSQNVFLRGWMNRLNSYKFIG